MQIVITDGFTLNPGDLDWADLRKLGELRYYARTAPNQTIDRCRDANIIVTNKTVISKEVLFACPGLKGIVITATGYNVVDIEEARKRKIPVCNVPEYGTHSVAQHTIALTLELTNKVGIHSESVAKGEWVKSVDWSYAKAPVIELRDKVLGIVGLGRIGNQTAKIAEALGMKVIHHRGKPEGVISPAVDLEEIFRTSDFVSLHCPLRQDNAGFVNQSLLSKMKRTAFLINTSRGQLINEHDLATALTANQIAGAALDVLSKEPPPGDHPLLNIRNCLITPHNAWLSFEARKRIMEATVENVKGILGGAVVNRVA